MAAYFFEMPWWISIAAVALIIWVLMLTITRGIGANGVRTGDGVSDEPKNRPRPWIGSAAAALLVLPILYVLAAGPIEWMCHHGVMRPEPAVTMYAPFRWARDNSETFRGLIDPYIGWFLRR